LDVIIGFCGVIRLSYVSDLNIPEKIFCQDAFLSKNSAKGAFYKSVGSRLTKAKAGIMMGDNSLGFFQGNQFIQIQEV
jgi:hypothetical protein